MTHTSDYRHILELTVAEMAEALSLLPDEWQSLDFEMVQMCIFQKLPVVLHPVHGVLIFRKFNKIWQRPEISDESCEYEMKPFFVQGDFKS